MNLTEILREHRVQFMEGGSHRHVRLGWLGLDCPWCGSSPGRYHLGVHLQTQSVVCWRCGRHGLAESLSRISGDPVGTWSRRLKGLERPDRYKEIELVHQGKLQLPQKVGDLLPAHIQYLKKRGFVVDELSKLWKIRGIGLSITAPWSIFIPIIYRGRVVSWTTRQIRDGGQRYVSAKPHQEAISHKTLLYGADYCFSTVLVTEGCPDCWAGGPGTVGVFGINVTRAQRRAIARYPNRVICFDNEVEAQKRARRLAEDLSVLPGRTSVVQIDAKDLGSAPRKEIQKLRRAVFGERV